MSTGEKIRFFRKKASLTQKALAARTGIAEITIRQYEAGKYTPKIEQLARIAAALNVTVAKLLPDSDTEDIGKRLFDYMGYDEVVSIHTNYESYLLMDSVVDDFSKLNLLGKKEAAKRVNELTQIKEYYADEIWPDEPKPEEE